MESLTGVENTLGCSVAVSEVDLLSFLQLNRLMIIIMKVVALKFIFKVLKGFEFKILVLIEYSKNGLNLCPTQI